LKRVIIGNLDYIWTLRTLASGSPCIVEEGLNRLLTRGTLHGDARSALFRLPENNEVLEYRVYIKAVRVSPFDLAASWRAYLENLQPSTVCGIPDVSIHDIPVTGSEV
jgi:6-phosphofructo-2-kinase/fructose-2,6-biphosphatase